MANENELTDYYICENREICQCHHEYCEPHGIVHKHGCNCSTPCNGLNNGIKNSVCKQLTIQELAVYRLQGGKL